jgi:predicted nuclease with TOPRIM domain
MSVSVPRRVFWRPWSIVLLAAALSAGAVGLLRAAPPPRQSAPPEDVLPALLVEVRGLRAAMEQMASAGPRIQLSVARLQLEEARINTMVHRLDGVHDTLATAQQELQSVVDQQKSVETRLTDNPNDPEREQLTMIASRAKREAIDRRATVSRLAAEEAQLTQDVAAEQSRWAEINQRLDELERALTKR